MTRDTADRLHLRSHTGRGIVLRSTARRQCTLRFLALLRLWQAAQPILSEGVTVNELTTAHFRAAVEEGVLPGGGVALLRAAKALETLKPDNPDQRTGVDIVRRAIQSPASQIATNAGEDGPVIVGKLLGAKDYAHGWNAQTGEYGDPYKWGIIDPAKVVRTAIEDAASVAGLIITMEAMIAEKPRSKPITSGAKWHGLLILKGPASLAPLIW